MKWKFRNWTLRRPWISDYDAGRHVHDREQEPDIVRFEELHNHYGTRPDVVFEDIVERRESDVRFQLACMMGVAYSVGDGYHIEADKSRPVGRKSLEVCEDFCDEWNLDELNQLIGLDVWAAGNAFLVPLREKQESLSGIRMLPLSSFKRIKRAPDGTVEEFVQEWGHAYKSLKPSGVYHFAWLPRNASAFGAGLGQAMSRKGVGYRATNGKRVQRPSMFEISEMTDDVAAKMTYAGVPRYLVRAPSAKDEDLTKLNNAFDRLDPLEHIIMNYKDADVSTINLDTQAKFDSFITKIDNQVLSGNMTPIPRMWSSLNFTYASAEAAIQAYMPLVKMYQRAHARFVENMIFTPLIVQQPGGSPEKVRRSDVRIKWGPLPKPTIEEIKQVWEILKDPAFAERYDPKDVLAMLQDAGVKLEVLEPQVEEVSAQVRDLLKLREQVGPGRKRAQQEAARESEREMRVRLMKKVLKVG